MKKLSFFIVMLIFNSSLLFSQVSVTTDGSAPDNSAMLDVKSTDKGLLLPRLTIYQQRTIENPAAGLIVFNIDSLDLYIYKGSYWLSVLKCDDKDTIFPWTCGDSIPISHVAGNIAPVDKTVTYGTVTNIPGEPSKCWITSNLGADHQPISIDDATEASAGWYWQFNWMQGYKHDGVTRTPNTTWINLNGENSDWIAANDPCTLELGGFWRIPTPTEWTNVDASGNWINWVGPYQSALKMHGAGALDFDTSSLFGRGYNGYYWSSSQNIDDSYKGRHLTFHSSYFCYVSYTIKAYGFSIRCLRD